MVSVSLLNSESGKTVASTIVTQNKAKIPQCYNKMVLSCLKRVWRLLSAQFFQDIYILIDFLLYFSTLKVNDHFN
jgi:hypothetical protein